MLRELPVIRRGEQGSSGNELTEAAAGANRNLMKEGSAPAQMQPVKSYSFEQTNTRRPTDSEDLQIFLKRLGIERDTLNPEQRMLCKRFHVDVLSNIRWYEERISRLEHELKSAERRVIWVGGCSLVLVVVIGMASLLAKGDVATGMGIVGGQLGFGLGSLVAVVQMLAGVRDSRGRISVFWKASADLKQVLYSFEDRWRGKNAAADPQFALELRAQIERARQISEEERLGYFQTYRNPADMWSWVSSTMTSLRARATEVAREQTASSQSTPEGLLAAGEPKRLAETEVSLLGAQADLEAKESYLKEIVAGGLTTEEPNARIVVKKAAAEVFRLQKLLEVLRARYT